MHSSRLLLCLALGLLFAAPAAAQDERPPQQQPQPPQQQRGSTAGPHAQRAAEAYGFVEWPAASAPRAGVDPRALQAPGWSQVGFEVDPRRGRATIALQRMEGPAGSAVCSDPDAILTLTLHADAESSRREMLGTLAAVTGRLTPEPNLGDVAFGGRRADGRLAYLTGVRGNVTFSARAAVDDVDVSRLAAALDAVIVEAAPLLGEQLPRPAATRAKAPGLTTRSPADLLLDLQPGAPAPAWIACEAQGLGLLQTESGWQVYASRTGPVFVVLHLCSAELQTATIEVELSVGRE
jgi:hypothetical protein